eukprot:tig00020930_g16047.t1
MTASSSRKTTSSATFAQARRGSRAPVASDSESAAAPSAVSGAETSASELGERPHSARVRFAGIESPSQAAGAANSKISRQRRRPAPADSETSQRLDQLTRAIAHLEARLSASPAAPATDSTPAAKIDRERGSTFPRSLGAPGTELSARLLSGEYIDLLPHVFRPAFSSHPIDKPASVDPTISALLSAAGLRSASGSPSSSRNLNAVDFGACFAALGVAAGRRENMPVLPSGKPDFEESHRRLIEIFLHMWEIYSLARRAPWASAYEYSVRMRRQIAERADRSRAHDLGDGDSMILNTTVTNSAPPSDEPGPLSADFFRPSAHAAALPLGRPSASRHEAPRPSAGAAVRQDPRYGAGQPGEDVCWLYNNGRRCEGCRRRHVCVACGQAGCRDGEEHACRAATSRCAPSQPLSPPISLPRTPSLQPAPPALRAPRQAPSLALSSRVYPAPPEAPLPPPRALAPPAPGPHGGRCGRRLSRCVRGSTPPLRRRRCRLPAPSPHWPPGPTAALRPRALSLAPSSWVYPAPPEAPLPPPRVLAPPALWASRRAPPAPSLALSSRVYPAPPEAPLPPPAPSPRRPPGPAAGAASAVSRAELAGLPRPSGGAAPASPRPRPAGPRAPRRAPPALSLALSSRVYPAPPEAPLPPPRSGLPDAGPRLLAGGRAPPPPPPFSIEVPDFDVDELLPGVPPRLAPTPVRPDRIAAALEGHPDPSLAARLAHGFAHGFPLQYRGPSFSAISRPEPSALEHIDVVRQDVEKEIAMGRVAGPFPSPPLAPFVASPVGAIPKKRSTKWRRIHNLSYPKHRGPSVNSGIDPDELHYQNTKVSRAIELLIQLGRGAEMAKADIESAFRLLAVRRKDWWLLGFALPSRSNPTILEFFIDLCLPFGARSSPRIFEDLGQALDFALRRRGLDPTRYVDDIFLIGQAGTGECRRYIDVLLEVCADLGIPLAPHKLEGPGTRLTFLGIELDSLAMVARLSPERLADLEAKLAEWATRSHASAGQLRSLAGSLVSAVPVVPAGRFFLRRVVAQLATLRANHHRARLHAGFHADLTWWRDLLQRLHGVRLIPTSDWQSAKVLRIQTDASNLGFGAVFGSSWTFGSWPEGTTRSMPWRELMALPALAPLLRSLYRLSALHHFEFRAVHVPGLENTLADPLSRLQISVFKERLPSADSSPTPPQWPETQGSLPPPPSPPRAPSPSAASAPQSGQPQAP